MNHVSPGRRPQGEPQRVPPVDADLLGSALFLVGEHLARLEAEERAIRDEEEDEEEEALAVDARAVLDLLKEELGTDPKTTLALYLRLTALFRLLSSAPRLAEIAGEPDGSGALTAEAIAAAAHLELHPDARTGGPGDFDPRAFRGALEDDA
jgi:hypothetical protein